MGKRNYTISILLVLLLLGVVTACNNANATPEKEFTTHLLVKAPDKPLSLFTPIIVQARVEDPDNYISHVELYAVEMPGNSNILLDSRAAPFEQTVFTASPSFTPIVPGDYIIKVVGYNKWGASRESEYIRFTVQQPNS